ncbi:SHOCT domain-containing protein [Chitinophaga sp. YIM B06452]|uniref:SHOCT domain-containing protein n=1 Tax=Chitinophaga sp. YIM B06452 TaxID=3082158 RepID=UPI0031FEEAA6
MKKSILIFFLFVAYGSNLKAQDNKNEYPRVNQYSGTLYMNQFDSYRKGDTILLGIGTLPSGDFKFATKSLAKIPLAKEYQKKEGRISTVRYQGNNRIGKKYNVFIIVDGVEVEIDIANALASGEVVSKNQDLNLPENIKSSYSVADEIRKLKALLDEGVLTKEEFEAQKKKLLEK